MLSTWARGRGCSGEFAAGRRQLDWISAIFYGSTPLFLREMQIFRGLIGGSAASAGVGKLQRAIDAMVLPWALAPSIDLYCLLERVSHGSQFVVTYYV
jgi:hypothetical protein